MKERPGPVHRFAAPIRSASHRFAYLGLVVTAFALMLVGKADVVVMERVSVHVTDAFAPIIDAMSRPAATVSELAARIREMAALGAENSRLRLERDRLLQWQAAARRLEAENEALRGLRNFQIGPEATFITARVIGDTGGAFANTLIINAGSRAGVRNGQAALTGVGLVGRTAHVGARSARVLLITDLNSQIPVIVEKTRQRAILAGDNSDQPRLILLRHEVTVSPGDRIVTSGHGGAFPAGLPVGVVAKVGDGGIKVQPFVERDRLEYVRIADFGLRGVIQPHATGVAGGREAAP